MDIDASSLRVLHIGESVLGGCGTYLNEVVPLQMNSLGVENIRCLVPRQHAEHLRDVPREAIWTFERSSRIAGLPFLAVAAIRRIRSWRPDVVHVHSTFAGVVVRALGSLTRLPPVVYCPHGWVFDVVGPGWKMLATQAVERWLSRRCVVIVAISEAERAQAIAAGISPTKLRLVRNGVSLKTPEQQAAWPDDRVKVLFVGRLDRQKGVDVLLEAVRNLEHKLSVRIVGKAVLSAHSYLVDILEPHVKMLGWLDLPDVAAQINAADMIVMPSRWEGFGLVAIEAMRAGKPVIASAVGGLVEIVVDGLTGMLVPAGDAEALRRVIDQLDKPQLLAMGRSGRERFEHLFTSDRTAAELLALYHSIAIGQDDLALHASPNPSRRSP